MQWCRANIQLCKWSLSTAGCAALLPYAGTQGCSAAFRVTNVLHSTPRYDLMATSTPNGDHDDSVLAADTLLNSARNPALEKWYMVFRVCRSDMTKNTDAPLAARGRYTSRCSDSVVCTQQEAWSCKEHAMIDTMYGGISLHATDIPCTDPVYQDLLSYSTVSDERCSWSVIIKVMIPGYSVVAPSSN